MIAVASNPTPQEYDQIEQGKRAVIVLAGLVGIGLAIILLYALQSTSIQQYLSVVGVSAVIAGASLLSGGLLGFLFGIPRILQQSVPPMPGASASGPEQLQYLPNTNLEEISDWLTKIIVGVGLTQISTVPRRLQAFANYAAPALGGFPGSAVFAIGILIYNLVCGFLIGYLWTRLYLAGAFREADELARLKKTVDALDQQVRDAKALRLVDQQLARDGNKPEISPADWNEAIAGASKSVQDQIFYRVDVPRPDRQNDPDTSFKRTRSIPILQALVASDKEGEYYKSRALLAIALIDQKSPDWNLAKTLLDEAIEIRNKQLNEGSKANRWYEYYRAICNMALDPNVAQNKAADENHRRLVADDLAAAANWTSMKDARDAELAKKNSIMRRWLDLNKDALPPVAGS